MNTNLHITYCNNIDKIEKLSGKEKESINPVQGKYAFLGNDYYLSLIDWNDPNDPIRRIIIPHIDELEDWGRLDPSDEKSYTVLPGLEHKYNSTALMLVSDTCGGICRYCFRKRVFIEEQRQPPLDVAAAVNYIREHSEITNVLLTGGDPLMCATEHLKEIISALRQIDHVHIIRIGTRMPVFNPYRIIDDPELLRLIDTYSTDTKRIYIMTHFDHPHEVTKVAIRGVSLLQKAGAIVCNQMPLIRGVNDDPEVMAQLFRELSFIGVSPYYVFQCRPAVGNRAYTVPIEEGYEIFEQAKSMVSGLAKRAKFVMSHASGKIEIVGKTDGRMYFKFHRAANDRDSGKFIVCKSNPAACWFDDYEEVKQSWPADKPYRTHGPE